MDAAISKEIVEAIGIKMGKENMVLLGEFPLNARNTLVVAVEAGESFTNERLLTRE